MKRILAVIALTLVGCASNAPKESPFVAVTCIIPGQRPVPQFISREKFSKLTFQNVPCIFEDLDSIPQPPVATVVPSPAASPKKGK